MRRAILLTVFLTPALLSAEDWPAWRGPRATGVSAETNLPERWTATENVAWQAALRGTGVSSPVVFGSLVFVTSQEGSGVRRQGNHPSLVQPSTAAPARARGNTRSKPKGTSSPSTTSTILHPPAR